MVWLEGIGLEGIRREYIETGGNWVAVARVRKKARKKLKSAGNVPNIWERADNPARFYIMKEKLILETCLIIFPFASLCLLGKILGWK